MAEDPMDLLQDFEIVDWFVRVFTDGPYMGELLFLSLIWAGLGLVMFIQTGGVAVPFVLTIIFAGVIGAAIGGTVGNFIAVSMVIVIPAVIMWLLFKGDR